MDPIRQPSGRIDQPDSDADISKILYKSGQTIKQAIRLMYRGVVRFFNGLLMAILFLLRNILWLALGTALGLGYGIYLLNKKGTKYQSQMIVKANFHSSRPLFNTIDYLNAVISSGKTEELSSLFHLSAAEVSSIDGFYIEPVESEIITAEMYKDLFIDNNRSTTAKADTVWLKTVSYPDFKKSLTKYDYPYYEISVIATNPVIFSKFKDGIIKQVSGIPLLNETKENRVATNINEEKLIKDAINGLDTLRQVYNQRLMKGTPAPENNQLTILQNTSVLKTPELDLYDKLLDLQGELRRTRNRSVTEENVIEVYSPFNAVGQRVSFLKQSIVKYSSRGLILTVIILLLIALYRMLVKLEKRKKFA